MLFAAGAAIALAYGRLGFMPLDQSIVFDGGWRILCGQRPFVDFMLPAGLVPTVAQAGFFAAFGVSWFAFCLHAAVVNGLFAVVIFELLRCLRLPAWMAGLYGLFSTVVLYPPFGVPFPDQHSFFFAACCLLATVKATTDSPAGDRWLASAPLFAALGLLSKPVPAAFIVLPCGLAWLLAAGRRGGRSRAALAAGVLATAAIAAAYLVIAGASARDVFDYAFRLPFDTARGRASLEADMDKLAAGLRGITLVAPWVVHAAGVWMLVAARTRRTVQLWLLAEGLLAASLLFVFVTNNEVVNGLAFVFLSAGVAVAAVLSRPRPAAMLFALAALVLCAADAWRINRRVNATRIVHDQYWDGEALRWSPGGALSFMRLNDSWATTDLRPILDYVGGRPEHFFLIGDSAVLYGATGHPSVLPALWMHPGLTMPPAGSAGFTRFARLLDRNLARYDVRYLIVESPQTLMGVSLDTFPSVAARTAGCERRRAGSWTVIELCRPPVPR